MCNPHVIYKLFVSLHPKRFKQTEFMQRRDGLIYINNVNGQQIARRMLGGLGNLYTHTSRADLLTFINIHAHPHVNIRLFLLLGKESRHVFVHRQEWRRRTEQLRIKPNINLNLFKNKILTEMKKRQYGKPTMKVVMLQHQPQLLQASGERPDYVPQDW